MAESFRIAAIGRRLLVAESFRSAAVGEFPLMGRQTQSTLAGQRPVRSLSCSSRNILMLSLHAGRGQIRRYLSSRKNLKPPSLEMTVA